MEIQNGHNLSRVVKVSQGSGVMKCCEWWQTERGGDDLQLAGVSSFVSPDWSRYTDTGHRVSRYDHAGDWGT